MTNYNNLFKYNKETGVLTRIRGKEMKTRDAYGYVLASIGKKLYKAHRIIWEMHNGAIQKGLVIDHINQIVDDNRLENLRIATKSLNAYNAKKRLDNTSGHVGVTWKKDKQKYKAYMTIDGKQTHIGYYITLEEAVLNRKLFEKEKLPFLRA